MNPNPSCHGKVRYRSFKEAQGAAKWQTRRHSEPFKVYACRACSGFHTAEGRQTNDRRPRAPINDDFLDDERT